MEAFNEHEWHPWKFPVVPKKFWMSHQSKLNYLEYPNDSLFILICYFLCGETWNRGDVT